MKTTVALLVFAAIVALGAGVAYLEGLRAERPPAPPPGSAISFPWGSMHVDEDQDEVESDLEKALAQSFTDERSGEFDEDKDGVREYAVLVLSGGGSAGAFGAGFLSGWSESGERPKFKIVTGVSTGSLQATFAFLGPDYDEALTHVFTQYGTENIYTERSILGALLGDSAWDSKPLSDLIALYITPEVLDAVAERHARGYRLFVGTSNMDTGEFIIWDMGAIASSNRPDRLERYRQVLLASCSLPVLFPPVYFPTEIDGEQYWEMHIDGGAQAQLFLRGFMLDFEDTLKKAIPERQTEISMYIIRNGTYDKEANREIIGASSLSIATATINGVFELSTEASLFRTYMLTRRYGIGFNMAAIPDDMFPELNPVVFDRSVMQALYDYAFEAARNGYDWLNVPPGLDPDEWIGINAAGETATD